jgi:myo-inositol-1-phosphate synthase
MAPRSRSKSPAAPRDKLGVWIFGARGGLSTTMVVGARAIAKGKVGTQGLLTETPGLDAIGLQRISGLVFGGHEVRKGTMREAAEEIYENTGTISYPLLRSLGADLSRVDKNIKRGCLVNAGKTILKIAGKNPPATTLSKEVARLKKDIRAFMKRHKLKRCVCVNLTSTEPKLRTTRQHETLEGFEQLIAGNKTAAVRPSAIYSYVAAALGLPFIHFTPSNAALVGGIRELFARTDTPYMGSDGKTGETLVKSSLAPMFKYRNLKVLTWQGYNILGDRDGVVLADQENKSSKIESKDALLSKILGYPLHTHVGIDYVPSLNDLKTAWDFIHFQGFLGYKMSMQFTWQGCDAILAAPIVLDMVRLADLAKRRGETGPMKHLSCFFKSPLDVAQHDLHLQWHLMTDYVRAAAKG